jgi:serine/threonine protein kinase
MPGFPSRERERLKADCDWGLRDDPLVRLDKETNEIVAIKHVCECGRVRYEITETDGPYFDFDLVLEDSADGECSLGIIFHVIDTQLMILLLGLPRVEISEIQAEITFLSNCNSPHITRYLGSFVGRKWTLWIIMEYLAGGSGSDIVSPHLLQ